MSQKMIGKTKILKSDGTEREIELKAPGYAAVSQLLSKLSENDRDDLISQSDSAITHAKATGPIDRSKWNQETLEQFEKTDDDAFRNLMVSGSIFAIIKLGARNVSTNDVLYQLACSVLPSTVCSSAADGVADAKKARLIIESDLELDVADLGILVAHAVASGVGALMVSARASSMRSFLQTQR